MILSSNAATVATICSAAMINNFDAPWGQQFQDPIFHFAALADSYDVLGLPVCIYCMFVFYSWQLNQLYFFRHLVIYAYKASMNLFVVLLRSLHCVQCQCNPSVLGNQTRFTLNVHENDRTLCVVRVVTLLGVYFPEGVSI